MKRYLTAAALGAALIASGVGLWDAPAGLVAAGVELVSAAYAGAYLQARKTAAPR